MSLLRHSYLLSILLASPAAAQNLDSLLARMTLEEKLGQLNLLSAGGRASPAQMQLARDGKLGGLFNVIGAENTTPVQRIAVTESRLKIPLLFGLDVIHGYRTIFPIPLAEAGSFDPDAAQATARAAGLEAAAAGISWTYAPMVDIARDPRWGRIAEGSGEDPYLGSAMAAARVRGFQGADPRAPDAVLATVKHFAAYGGAEGGRDYNTVDLSERTLREVYLPPYRAALDAGAATVMTSFNEIGGSPSTASPWLMTTLLRREWGFRGFVVSDWTAVAELMSHGDAQDAVTPLEGIKQRAGSVSVVYEKGCGITDTATAGFAGAIAAAKQADVAVLVLGEAGDMSGEAASRANIDVPGVQPQLLEAISATGTPIVLVVMSGRPLTIPWAAEHVPAILESWFLGVDDGPALAALLFGDVYPSGKLPATFPRSVGQIPLYYNHKNTGRPTGPDKYTSKYTDLPVTPLFPFGHGLSYTTFGYSDLRLSAPRIAPAGTLKVSVTVTNTGAREGAEVVQLYVHDEVASVTRPVRALAGFRRVSLKPGEARTVDFQLTSKELGLYNRDMKFVVEPGKFRVFVGGSSVGGLEAEFEVARLR